MSRATTFDEVYRSVADVRGWMTRAQAGRLWDRACELYDGDLVVEIGSFQGRSMIVLASASPEGVRHVAIDPHGGNDRGPQEIAGFEAEAEADHEAFLGNLERTGVRDRVTHLRMFSDAALGEVTGRIDLLYIDGAHRFRPALDDIRSWGAKVPLGGTMLIHDSFSSVGVTLALMASTFFGSRWRYIARSGSMAEFRRTSLGPLARVVNGARQSIELGYFVRNLVVKLAITLRLRPLWRLLGSNGEWPY